MSKKIIKKIIPSTLQIKKDPKQPPSPPSPSPWQWPSCKQHPKTLSFRDDAIIFKTHNSIFLHPSDEVVSVPDSWFTTTSSSDCTTNSDDHNHNNGNNNNNNNNNNNVFHLSSPSSSSSSSVETIIRGAVKSSNRLFFEPGRTSSILEEEATKARRMRSCSSEDLPFKESVALALESEDPYSDFKESMQEMVESQGLKDWECLEELLGWYLRMNKRMNHGIIVGAFVDLLVGLAADTTDNASNNNNNNKNSITGGGGSRTPSSYSSADSCFSSPRSVVGVLGEREDEDS